MGMTKPKISSLSIAVLSVFAMHLVTGAQFLNAICVAPADVTVISSLTKIQASL